MNGTPDFSPISISDLTGDARRRLDSVALRQMPPHYTACAAERSLCSALQLARSDSDADRPFVTGLRRRIREVSAMGNSKTARRDWREARALDAVACVRPGRPAADARRRAGDRWLLRGSRMPALAAISALLLGELLAACGGGSAGAGGAIVKNQTQDSGSPSELPPTQTLIGHYVGSVKIAGVSYFADAVFTLEGAVRMYVGGPYDASGVLPTTRPASSEQFVGTVQMQAGQWSGSGTIIGQGCATDTANRFCAQPSSAKITAAVQADPQLSVGANIVGEIQGELEVATTGQPEIWSLNLMQWIYDGPVFSAQYKELLAEFAPAADAVVSVDSSGRLFFQSASSGCVGNGTLVASGADGSAGIDALTLLMESCTGTYAYLNGTYDGLALMTPGTVWDYDSWLRVWLSKRGGQSPPAAMTMLGELL
jgi:hypothetical protein